MKKQLSLVKPQLETAILDNEISEKATYLRVPARIDLEELTSDIRLGAVQFAELTELVQKEKTARYILINTDNLEQGYLAVSYLASCLNLKGGWGCADREEDEENFRRSEWEESPYEIPVIEEGELKLSISDGNGSEPFGMGGFFSQGRQNGLNKKPYWYHCQKESVCIVADSQAFCFGSFGSVEMDERLAEGLKHFIHNERVFIINVQEQRETPDIFDELGEDEENGKDGGDSLGPSIYVDADRARWNYIVLSYSADEVKVNFGEDKGKEYYKQVLRGVIRRKGLKAKKGFSYEHIVNIVMAMNDLAKCGLTEKIVNYAVKDWPSERWEIGNGDFNFIDRFVTVDVKRRMAGLEAGSGDRKPRRAYERLQQELVGMESVKEQVLNIVNVMKYNRLRQQMHISGGSYHNVHVMLGAPGTAKTTVAKLMGQIMVEEELLPDNRFACVNGAELKGMYVGHSAPKTKALFEHNDIIVIDEAYSIVGDNGDCDSFSKEAIAQLIIELENHAMDKLVIFAGYGGKKVSEKNNKMKDFLDANPGIKSRITSTIYFDSYSPQEMAEIFYRIAKIQQYEVEEAVRGEICEFFGRRMEDDNFGNGREARSLLETSVLFAAKRVFAQKKKKYARADMQKLLASDVRQAMEEMERGQLVQHAGQKRRAGFM